MKSMSSTSLYAAIDLGSNSFHMLVVREVAGSIQTLSRIKRKVRLAAGLNSDNTLSAEAMERGWQCLRLFAERLQDIPPTQIRVVATATLRLAVNAEEFLAKAQEILGTPVQVISGEEEARLIYQGVAHTTGGADQRLVVDIGGFTADYVRLRNGVPDMAACDSLENGVILLYNRICAKANAELDILLEESEIDRILRGEDQDAAPEVIALAEREAQEFINDLLSGLRERMLELKSGKVIFLGGGATLLRRQIEASGKIGQAIFVEDINANAKGYEYLYRLQHSGR